MIIYIIFFSFFLQLLHCILVKPEHGWSWRSSFFKAGVLSKLNRQYWRLASNLMLLWKCGCQGFGLVISRWTLVRMTNTCNYRGQSWCCASHDSLGLSDFPLSPSWGAEDFLWKSWLYDPWHSWHEKAFHKMRDKIHEYRLEVHPGDSINDHFGLVYNKSNWFNGLFTHHLIDLVYTQN